MSEQATFHTPQTIAAELDVSSATLRRWSDKFSDYLSTEASSLGRGRSHRRYTDGDLVTLRLVKELMNNGMTYDQVNQQLATLAISPEQMSAESSRDNFTTDETFAEERSLVASNGNESAAVAFLTNTLATLSDNQKSLLNSQAANRELMGVLIQDNFNLKEENNRLRERILEVERSMAQSRQESEWQRETIRQELDAKISSVQKLATEAMTTAQSTPTPEIKAVKSKPGCLGSLLGGGDIQIFSVPGRREKRADGRAVAGQASMPLPPQPPEPTPRVYPKPTLPPE